MQDAYCEDGVKVMDTIKNKLIRVGLILACVVSFFLVPAISQILIVVPVVLIAVTVFVIPRLNAEYEYIYADGQIDFDKISGNAGRKTKLRIDLDNCEVVAPVDSDAIRAYDHNQNIVVNDYSSLSGDMSKVYAAICSKDGNMMKVLFEPSEKMVKLMKMKAPSKVKTDAY